MGEEAIQFFKIVLAKRKKEASARVICHCYATQFSFLVAAKKVASESRENNFASPGLSEVMPVKAHFFQLYGADIARLPQLTVHRKEIVAA